MTRTSPIEDQPRVIKKHQVMSGGSRRLGSVGGCAAAAPAGPTARIVQAGDGAAGIEVACSCGRVIYLQVECAPQAPQPAGDPAPADGPAGTEKPRKRKDDEN